MDEKPVTADVVVACIAGFGAWGAAGINVTAADTATYAAELFGEGADALTITYPSSAATPPVVLNPKVSITWDSTHVAPTANAPAAEEELNPAIAADSVVEITWTLSNATFGEPVQASDFTAGGFSSVAIESGGAKDDASVTIKLAVDSGGSTAEVVFPTDNPLTFTVPRLNGISALADPSKTVRVTASLRITTGSVTSVNTASAAKPFTVMFPTGRLGAANIVHSAAVVMFAESGKEKRTGDDSTRININDRMMFQMNAPRGPFSDGGATVNAYRPMTYGVTGQAWAAQLAYLTVTIMSEVAPCSAPATDAPNCGQTILQWDGTRVDSDVAGVLDIDVTGAIREGDMVFANQMDVDHWASPWTPGDKRTIDSGESLAVTEGMAEFTSGGFSIDPGNTDEDDPSETLRFGVYYIPNGKDELAHGAMIHLSAIVNFTRSSSVDKGAKTTNTELRFHGVDDAVKAYAIPFDGNGKGDMANVRIRCEAGDQFSGGKQCRPFLECWDDMGTRMFGESAMIATDALDVLNSMEIETVIGATDPASRHSCRVLSTGTTSVQTLVRDGSSGTLVNNSQVN